MINPRDFRKHSTGPHKGRYVVTLEVLVRFIAEGGIEGFCLSRRTDGAMAVSYDYGKNWRGFTHLERLNVRVKLERKGFAPVSSITIDEVAEYLITFGRVG